MFVGGEFGGRCFRFFFIFVYMFKVLIYYFSGGEVVWCFGYVESV